MSVQAPGARVKTFHVSVTSADGAKPITSEKLEARAVKLRALAANTDKVYAGDSTVTTASGDEIGAGESVTYDVANPHFISIATPNAAAQTVAVTVLLVV